MSNGNPTTSPSHEGGEEVVYVLYGSQTGNSEQAAKEIHDEMSTRLSAAVLEKIRQENNAAASKVPPRIVSKVMQLDDFLELHHAPWPRLMVIVVSSYGVGQAPIGAIRFRELCDHWLKQPQTHANLLQGIQFFMCGLGDSKYPTFFNNPTVLNKALETVGAKRIGPLGKVDASDKNNEKVLQTWKDGIWEPMAKKLALESPLESNVLQQKQRITIELMKEINPDYKPPVADSKQSQTPAILTLIPLIVGIMAVILYYYIR